MSYIENRVTNLFLIAFIILFLVLLSLFFFSYQPYKLIYGEVNESYVNIFLTDQEITNLNYKLKYDKSIQDYKIVEVSSNYILHENTLKRNVKINFDYDKSKYILELHIGLGKETNIWDYLYQKYMKGVI